MELERARMDMATATHPRQACPVVVPGDICDVRKRWTVDRDPVLDYCRVSPAVVTSEPAMLLLIAVVRAQHVQWRGGRPFFMFGDPLFRRGEHAMQPVASRQVRVVPLVQKDCDRCHLVNRSRSRFGTVRHPRTEECLDLFRDSKRPD